MKVLVTYLAMLLGMVGPSLAIATAQPTPPPHDSQAAFDYACTVLEYDCSGLAPPTIVWDSLYNTFGALGMYDGGETIYMDNTVMRFADPVMIQSVIAHETAHYLDVKLGVVAFPFTMESVCTSEFNAWRVGNVYVLTHGRPDLADFGWAERYGCFL